MSTVSNTGHQLIASSLRYRHITMSRVFMSVAFVVLAAVASTSALTETDFKSIDNLLFNPFCERQSVQSILQVCTPPLVVNPASKFGVDAYTTAATGNVTTGAIGGNNLKAVFLVAVPSKDIKCRVQSVSDATNLNNIVKIVPVSTAIEVALVEGDFAKIGTTTEYETSAAYSDPKGVLIKIDTPLSIKCAW